jgi:hypothetical protein
LALVLLAYRTFQVPIFTLHGALPGSGGAIIAVTQYTRCYLGFGSVLATLTTTMGDAMFLFLTRDPHTALLGLRVSMINGANPACVGRGNAHDIVRVFRGGRHKRDLFYLASTFYEETDRRAIINFDSKH